jgi:YegS/Rv2252/BmrU family lipid kinase
VHYPFDVIAGAAIGTGMGLSANALIKAGQEWRDARTPAPRTQRPQTNQVVLITSPNAGKANKKLERARKALSDAGLEVVEEFSVDQISRAEEMIKKSDRPPIMVAAGGDGTVGAVSNLVVGTSAVLGVLPLGTSNDFARSLQLPMRIEHAARLLAAGKVSTIDAGRLTENGKAPRYFVHAATAGLNVNFARLATRADLRHRLGRLTYAAAGVMALRERPTFNCEVTLEDGIKSRTLEQLSVINTPVIGGALGLKVPGADPSSRTLQLLLVEHLPMRRLMRSLLNNLLGRPRLVRGVTLHSVTRVAVTPEKAMDVALDGEICGQIPGTFEVVPNGLRVITRARYGLDA